MYPLKEDNFLYSEKNKQQQQKTKTIIYFSAIFFSDIFVTPSVEQDCCYFYA